MRLLVVVWLLGIILVSCTPAENVVSPPESSTSIPADSEEEQLSPEDEEGEGSGDLILATYTDEADYFSISYPQEWEPFPSWFEELGIDSRDFFKVYDPDVSLEGLFFIFMAEAPMVSGVSSASVNIVVQALSDMTVKGWLTLDEIVEGKLQRTEEIEQGYYEYSRINIIIDGREAVIIDWESYTSDDLSGKVRCIQMFTIVDELVWKITCYADSEKFEDFEDDLHAIVKSLQILK